jgi:hypothetical protein
MDSGEGSKAAKSDRNSNSKSRGKSPKQRGKSPKRTKSGSGSITTATTSNHNTSSSTHNNSTSSNHDDADRSFSNHRSVREAMKRDATLGSQQLPPLPSDGDNGHNNAHSNNMTAETVLDVIPPEYLYDPQGAEPSLHYLPKVVASSILAQTPHPQRGTTSNSNSNSNAAGKFPTLRMLLEAAQDDIRLHRARQQAGINRHVELLRSYKLETDPLWLSRQQRLNERLLTLTKLDNQRSLIFNELQASIKGLTAQEKTQVQLARWQRALELFVYAPPKKTNDKDGLGATTTTTSLPPTMFGKSSELDLWGLLEKLLEGISEVR